MQTDYARVKTTYTILFNVLALKFTSHGSAHILATEILVLKDRMMPLLLETAGLVQMETDKRMSKLRQMSFASRSEAASSMDTDFAGRGSARASRKTAMQAALQSILTTDFYILIFIICRLIPFLQVHLDILQYFDSLC